MLRGIVHATTVLFTMALAGCSGSGNVTDAGSSRDFGPMQEDAGPSDDAGEPVDSAIDAPAIVEDAGVDPAQVAAVVQEAAQSSMASSAVASFLSEVTSLDEVSAALGLRAVPHGDVLETAPGVTDRAAGDCTGSGEDHLAQCPAAIVCPGSLIVLHWGDGCAGTSGRRITGYVRIEIPLVRTLPWRWRIGVTLLASDGTTLAVEGSLRMTRPDSGGLLFQHEDLPLMVRIPRARGDREVRPFAMSLSDISITQAADGSYLVRGPDTWTLTGVPISCGEDGGASTTISVTIDTCGGWLWPVPITSCLCPSSGELRIVAPLLAPCTNPTSLQTLVVTFSPPSATAPCGSNMTGWLYNPSTRCMPSCGACNKGICIGGLCSNALDVSAVLPSMVGWICTLPQAVCGAFADAGVPICPDGGFPIDAALRDGDAPDSRGFDGTTDILPDGALEEVPRVDGALPRSDAGPRLDGPG